MFTLRSVILFSHVSSPTNTKSWLTASSTQVMYTHTQKSILVVISDCSIFEDRISLSWIYLQSYSLPRAAMCADTVCGWCLATIRTVWALDSRETRMHTL